MNAMHQPGRALILVVDDEQRNVQMLEMMLEQNGYRTVSAGSGRAALMLAVDRMPDLILVDAKMPDVDGFELCDRGLEISVIGGREVHVLRNSLEACSVAPKRPAAKTSQSR